METDKVSVNAPCDKPGERNAVSDTITVTSNRSWSAWVQQEDCDWIRLETDGYENPGGALKDTPLILKILDNEKTTARQADICISCGGLNSVVTVSQAAITYRLALKTPAESFLGLSSYGAKLTLDIDCNTSWTAALESGATAGVAILSPSGKYSASIPIGLTSHKDTESGKEAVIVVSATGCEDIRIPLTQKAAPVVPGVEGHGFDNFSYDDHGTK